MEGRLNGPKTSKSWLLLGGTWTIATTLGWLLAWALMVVMAAAFSVPDSDAARIYLNSSLWERVSDRLWLGATIGLVPAAVLGLLLWFASRMRKRNVLLTVLGTVVGSALLCVVASAGGSQVESEWVTTLRLGVLGGVVGGGFAGLCQWDILRRQSIKRNGWIPLTVAGWVVICTIAVWATGIVTGAFEFHRGLDAGLIIGPMEARPQSLVLSVVALLAGGAVLGLGQWLLLRRDVKRAGWWILATAVGLGAVWGAGVGIVTGITLVLLLRHAELSHCSLSHCSLSHCSLSHCSSCYRISQPAWCTRLT